MSVVTELNAVSLSKGGTPILRDISVSLTERRVGIVGRNGSGKTSLLRVIAGLDVPETGSSHINGVAVAKDRKAAISKVGFLFQNPDHQIIFPTVEEEIGFGLTQLGLSNDEAAERTVETLASFGCVDWAERAVSTLSQGQRHLVCLMSVLAMAPNVIILDEPFTGLDVPTTAQLKRVLEGLCQQIIHVSHDTAIFEAYDRVLWIEGGQIADDGPPCAVLKAYTSAMTAAGERDDLTHIA